MMYVLHLLLNIALLAGLIWLCMFFVLLVHELGHVLMYRIFLRDKDWHITLGKGRALLRLKRFTIKPLMLMGSYRGLYKGEGSKLQDVMVYAGGPMASALLLLVLWLVLPGMKAKELSFEQENLLWVLSFAFWMNLSVLLTAVIPMQHSIWPYKNYISDGMRIKRRLIDKG